MIRAIGLSTLFFLLHFSSIGFASTAEVVGFFPGYCEGTPDKAVRAFDTSADISENAVTVSFKAALLECIAGAETFSSYVPREGEYVEVYEIASARHRPVYLPIPQYEEGLNYSLVSFTIPLERVNEASAFRVDLFLYGDMIPLKLTISEDGRAVLAKVN